MATWPTELPQVPLRQGYQKNLVDTVIRSNMGYGPAKTRQRTTSVMYQGQFQMHVTDAQKDILDQFYLDNMAVSWTLAWPNADTEYRFTAPPQYQEITCDLWAVFIPTEILP